MLPASWKPSLKSSNEDTNVKIKEMRWFQRDFIKFKAIFSVTI